MKHALQTRIKEGRVSTQAAKRLRDVLDWTKPGLVAEVWQQGRVATVQYLLVDVPQRPELAAGVTHFDRVSETVAHCVSGNSLSPGDYPVGQAIAHPTQPDILFHLVNTPTPRLRMGYPYTLQQPESQRLRELTRRTLRGWIDGRRHLTDLEMLMLKELDTDTASRMIGEYFSAVDDQPSETPGRFALGGRLASHHGKLCYVLSGVASADVIPGVTKAIGEKRFLPPVEGDAPYHLPWVACLAVAARTPGEEIDRWLQEQAPSRQPLLVGPGDDMSDTPTLGATAAALLLKRQGVVPAQMGLSRLNHKLLENAGCPGYRYDSPVAKRRLLHWWDSRRDSTASPAPTP